MAKQVDPKATDAQQAAAPDDKFAALEALVKAQAEELALFRDMLKAGAVNAVDATQEERSRKRHEDAAKWLDQGKQKITQDACDALFQGKHRYTCVLADGNDHPEIVVSADHEVDAAARYLVACGIRSAEKSVSVTRA